MFIPNKLNPVVFSCKQNHDPSSRVKGETGESFFLRKKLVEGERGSREDKRVENEGEGKRRANAH